MCPCSPGCPDDEYCKATREAIQRKAEEIKLAVDDEIMRMTFPPSEEEK
jgi:hypothetical protein